MYKVRMAFLCLAFLVGFADYSNAEDVKKVTCRGKVVDSQGQPIAGAKVRLYELADGVKPYAYEMDLTEGITTQDDGAFSFTKEGKSEEYRYGVIVVEKQGLAIGWANWNRHESEDFEIKLSEATELAGVVVDENDKPIAEVEVSIYMMVIGEGQNQIYMTSKVASKLFITKTDKQGKFVFTQIPAEATAEFLVSKSGRATFSSWTSSRSPLNYKAGQEDIKLVQPIEAKIEGIVVEKGTDNPIADVKLMPMQGRNHPDIGQEPVVSKSDGTFTINALTTGTHILQLVQPKETMADWVAETLEVTTQAGITLTGIKIEASKVGLLEVSITNPEKKPVEKASVNIHREETDQWLNCRSDKDGLARIRLLAGDYQVRDVHKEGYSTSQEQTAVTIQENETVRIDIELVETPKITGTVRDGTGKPVEGASVKVYPMGSRNEIKTDTKGRYELAWDPRSWGPQSDTIHYLVVRHVDRNLAVAVEVGEETKTLDIKLMEGVVFSGEVVDTEGKPIAGAKITVMLRASNWGSTIRGGRRGGAVTDAKGKFEVKAIPPERKYDVQASGEGYGEYEAKAFADDAEDGRLDVGRFTLALANLSVSGIVVDSDDKPAGNARVHAYGKGQPDNRHNIMTDAEGKFIIEKVCPGRININARTQGNKRLYGSVQTEGGATDVKIVVAERSSSRRFVPKQPKSLAGKSLPVFDGLGLQIDSNEIAGKNILVCFWDMQQRPSRHCIKELAKQAEMLKEKGVVVIAVQASKVDADKMDEWVKKYNLPFPVGIIEGDEEKTKFSWGVKSLPWLILTDKKHIVSSNGFSLSELEEKMKGMAN